MVSDPTLQTPAGAARTSNVPLAAAGLAIGVLLSVLDQTVVATALPQIAADVGGIESISWVATSYLLAATATGALYGRISDRYGRRATFLTAVAIFTLASLLCGLADSLSQLVTFRAVQGVGAGALFVVPTIALPELFPPERRARVQGYLGGVFAFSSVGGPLIGGLLTDQLSWRWIFYINLPLGLIAIGLVGLGLRLSRGGTTGRLDLPGSALLVAAVVGVLLVAEWGGREYGWGSATIIGLAAAAVVLLVAFGWWERRAGHPILPPRLLVNPVLRLAIPATLLLGGVLYGTIFFLPTYFQEAHDMSPTIAGLALVPGVFTFVLASAVSGRLAVSAGRAKWLTVAGAVVMTAGLGLLGRLGEGSSYGLVAAEIVVFGVGVGLIMQLLVTVAQNVVDHADIGATTSAILSTRAMGTALGVSFFGTLLGRQLAAGQPVASAIPHVFGWEVPIAVALLLCTLALPARSR
ncbi:MAG: DHA2 family efflux MFS transporter permease subunit [Streptosporangiales bacterium]|nr:DHA2 family efflux MFS transporter permease subunit [Streptosporangiales bacterium]